MDETEVAGELLTLAEAYEAKAKRLRDAAAVLVGTPAPLTSHVPAPPTQAAIQRRLESNQRPVIESETYEKVIAAQPGIDWDAPSLADAILAETGVKINKEAARTMLYRLDKRGVVEKSGRGTWRMVQKDVAPTPFSQDPLGRPFVTVG